MAPGKKKSTFIDRLGGNSGKKLLTGKIVFSGKGTGAHDMANSQLSTSCSYFAGVVHRLSSPIHRQTHEKPHIRGSHMGRG